MRSDKLDISTIISNYLQLWMWGKMILAMWVNMIPISNTSNPIPILANHTSKEVQLSGQVTNTIR